MMKIKMPRRKGSLTIELVLIFPVLMLLFFLFFQVSVMLVTYHSLQTTVSHAALAATTASSLDEITAVVNAGAANWYYSPESALAPVTNSEEWNDGNELKFRILVQDGTGWAYASMLPAPGTNMMVEIKLAGMQAKFPQLWLMPQFKGVDAQSDSFVVSAMGRRQ